MKFTNTKIDDFDCVKYETNSGTTIAGIIENIDNGGYIVVFREYCDKLVTHSEDTMEQAKQFCIECLPYYKHKDKFESNIEF